MKKLLSTIMLMFFGLLVFAKSVPMDFAKNIATNYYKEYAPSRTSVTISDSFETTYQGVTTFYTFIFQSGGFVMVAADDAVTPIIGFSDTELFDKNNIPEDAQAFFNEYSAEIKNIIDANLSNKETLPEWNMIATESFDRSRSTMAVTPLCVTSWNQNSPYNTLCPSGTPTGCVATAMAQIMKKWNYPTTGTGSRTYTHDTYGVQTANFGATTYDWTSMTNTYSSTSTTAAKSAVATLMFHCGVSVKMNYAPSGSGALSIDIPTSLVNYFGYQPSAELKSRSLFQTDAAWLTLIKTEMDQGRPVFLSGIGSAAGSVGHQFVCDGYNPSSLFHINWGWGGSSNGYFSLIALNPSGKDFSSSRQAVIRVRPLSTIIPVASFTASNTIPKTNEAVNFTDQSTNSPTSWSWTFDGGSPATSTAKNPTVTFSTNGYHLVSLTVSNANGTDTKTREHYINVGGAPSLWIKQNSGFQVSSRGINQIFVVDANTVWAKAYDGINPVNYIQEFTRTNNGGTTWNPGTITFTGSTNYAISNIHAFDYNTAYACMFPVTGAGGAIVKTTDGGTTWTKQPSADFSNSWANFVHFFDANNGICMGDPTKTTGTEFFIYTTSNGGATWTAVPNANIPNSLASETGIVNLFSAVGNTIWFSTTKGRIFKSTDKGLNWTATATGFTHTFTTEFKDANVGIAVLDTLPYSMSKTNDGGATWTPMAPTGYVVKRPILAFVPGTTSTWFDVAYYPSTGSTYSKDDGATFVNIDSGSVKLTTVAFLNASTGWAGGFNLSATDDGIYKWDPSAITSGIEDPNSKQDDGITVYPVPTNNIVNIVLGQVQADNMVINVYNMLGAKVMSEKQKAISNDIIQLDLSDKEEGLYFINITIGDKTTTKKVTIVR
jgi:PKD repeat protein